MQELNMDPNNYNDVKSQHTLLQFTITKRSFVRVQFAVECYQGGGTAERDFSVYQNGQRTKYANNSTGQGKSFAWEFSAEAGLIEFAAFWKTKGTWAGLDLVRSSGGASHSVYDFDAVTVTIE